MKFDRRRLMLWVVLVVSTLYTSYSMLTRTRTPAPRSAGAPENPAAAPASAPAPAVPAAAAAAPPAPPLAAAELSTWRARVTANQRDPFFTLAEINAMNRPVVAPRPVDAPPPTPATYIVKLIMMQGSSGRALIDGRVVREGDMLGDERVVEIVPDAVVLERGRERRILPLAKAASGRTIQLERTR